MVLLLGLHGCGGMYSIVEFEVLEPATIHFPDQINQILVLNRAPLTLDAFREEDRVGMRSEHLRILDTLICSNINRGLLEVLRQSPVRSFRVPIWLSDRRGDTTNLEDLILTRREVESICRREGGDAIISLESYSMDIDEQYEYYTDATEDAPDEIMAHYYQVSNKVLWYIYLPGNPKPFDRYTTIDTLYFPRIVDGLFMNSPSIAQMIRDLFFESGLKYGKYLVPIWINASRILFKGRGDSLRMASELTREGNWDEAYLIWEELSRSKDSTIASKALHNMAVYHELEDDLDSASFLIDMALQYDSLDAVKEYRDEMDVRLLNRNQVIEQVY
jgi:hypothetical protein